VGQLGRRQEVVVEPNRWYDVKIEAEGHQIRCYLDGQLVADRSDIPMQGGRGQFQQGPPAPIYATAVRDATSGDVILRVVNTEGTAHSITVNLQGVKSVGKQAQVEVLTGQPLDVNTVEKPMNVAPKTSTIDNAALTFTHDFPGNSFSVIRLKAQ
jgi:alpha-L-arabinofuranosidase